jgi:hypothetical protein
MRSVKAVCFTIIGVLISSVAFGAGTPVSNTFSAYTAVGGKVRAIGPYDTMHVSGATFSKPAGKSTMTIPTASSEIAAASVATPADTATFGFLDTVFKKLTWANIKATMRGGVAYDTDYASLSAAVSAIGSTPRTLKITADQALSSNVAIPSTLQLVPVNGARILGPGTVTGLDISHAAWFADKNPATDDTTNLLRWVASSAHLILDDGTYLISRQGSEGVILGLRSNVTVEGTKNAILKYTSAVDATNFWRMIGISHSTGGAQNFENITLRGFTMDGSTSLTDYDAAHEQNHGVFFFTNQGGYIRNLLIEELNIHHFSGDCVASSTGTRNVTIRNVMATDWLRQGVNFAGSGSAIIENNYAYPLPTVTYSGSGVHCEPTGTVSGLYVRGNDANAILVSGDSAAFLLKNARIYSNTVTGKIGGSWYDTVEINSNTCGQIEVSRALNTKIHHNTVNVTTDVDGITISLAAGIGSNISVDNNTVSTAYPTPTGYGIYLNQNAGQSAKENHSTGFKYGIGVNGGSNSVVTGNYATGTTYALLLGSTAGVPSSGVNVVARNVFSGTSGDIRVSDSTWVGLHLDKNKLVNGTLSLSGNPTFKFDDYPSISADKGNAGATLTVGSSPDTNLWATPITADRAVALSVDAKAGAKFRIVRAASATGAYNLNVGTGPLKALAAGQWCVVEFDGSAWVLTAYGTL